MLATTGHPLTTDEIAAFKQTADSSTVPAGCKASRDGTYGLGPSALTTAVQKVLL